MTVKNMGRRFERSDFVPHAHQNNSEILYITNGQGRVVADGEIYNVEAGDIVFCPAGCEHTGPGGACGLIYIVADVHIPYDVCHHFIVHDDEKHTVGAFFETIYDVYNRPSHDIAYKNIESSLCELIFELTFNIKRQIDQDREVNALCNVIEQKFSDENFQLGNEMQRIARSVTYLRRKFVESVGMSPAKYLNTVRTDHAKKLIARRLENHMSMGEISEKCGFSDERYFTRVFKQYTNMTPGEYYKQIK